MSRDVAYRNGYLPLYAGAELVRRSGSLTQFPADNLIGTLPTFGGFKYRAPPELVGQPIVFGFANSLKLAYIAASGQNPDFTDTWTITGFTPSGVIPEAPDYLWLRQRHYSTGPGDDFAYTFKSGNHVGLFSDPSMGVVNEAYRTTMSLSGSQLASVGAVYPSGVFNTIDAYLEACGMPFLSDAGGWLSGTVEVTWTTPYLGVTGNRTVFRAYSTGPAGTDWRPSWENLFLVRPYDPALFDPSNTVQSLFGGIDMLYGLIWAAEDAELTANGFNTKNLLRQISPSAIIGGFTLLGLPFRDPDSLSAGELSFVTSTGMIPALMPGSVPRSAIATLGPSFRNATGEFCRSQRNALGVWSAPTCEVSDVAGLTAINTTIGLGSSTYNQFITQLTLPGALAEQVFVSGT